ncbi:MAG: hypothetical protein LBI57_05555 [Helicobacteraceae bacterium]|nr:hypothetical protein [Helicobacteraceae bacterium]
MLLLRDRLAKQGAFLFRRRGVVPLFMIAVAALELFPKNAQVVLGGLSSYLADFKIIESAAQDLLSLSLSLSV